MRKYYGLFAHVEIEPKLILHVIYKLTDNKDTALRYQLKHYAKTGKCLEIKPVKSYFILANVVSGGFSLGTTLFGSAPNEKEANKILNDLSAVFPMLSNLSVRKIDDVILSGFFIRESENA